jgi:hypothetical protein
MSRRRTKERRATPEWREFERFVAMVEAGLAHRGALIRCPDRLRDSVTGRLREVDASLLHPDGTRVILECRLRGRVQDDTWIEQLAVKREKVGAALAVAVSSQGFSASATKTAAHYGILLRRMADVTANEVAAQWVRGWEAGFLQERVHPRALAVYCEPVNGETARQVSLAPEIAEALRKNLDAAVAFREPDGTPLSLRQLLERVKTDDVPTDGQVYERDLRLKTEPGAYYVKVADGRRRLAQLHLVATIQKLKLPLDNVRYHEYSGPGGPRAELSKGSTVLPGQDVPHELHVVLIPPDEPESPDVKAR